MARVSKTQLILSYLMEGNTLNQLEATRDFGTTRLGSIIFGLRKKHIINTEIIVVKDRYGNECEVAQYSYVGPKEA